MITGGKPIWAGSNRETAEKFSTGNTRRRNQKHNKIKWKSNYCEWTVLTQANTITWEAITDSVACSNMSIHPFSEPALCSRGGQELVPAFNGWEARCTLDRLLVYHRANTETTSHTEPSVNLTHVFRTWGEWQFVNMDDCSSLKYNTHTTKLQTVNSNLSVFIIWYSSMYWL